MPVTAAVAEAVAPHLAAAYPAALRTATSQLLLSLAKLDADALWLLLFRLAQQVLCGPCSMKGCADCLHHYTSQGLESRQCSSAECLNESWPT